MKKEKHGLLQPFFCFLGLPSFFLKTIELFFSQIIHTKCIHGKFNFSLSIEIRSETIPSETNHFNGLAIA